MAENNGKKEKEKRKYTLADAKKCLENWDFDNTIFFKTKRDNMKILTSMNISDILTLNIPPSAKKDEDFDKFLSVPTGIMVQTDNQLWRDHILQKKEFDYKIGDKIIKFFVDTYEDLKDTICIKLHNCPLRKEKELKKFLKKFGDLRKFNTFTVNGRFQGTVQAYFDRINEIAVKNRTISVFDGAYTTIEFMNKKKNCNKCGRNGHKTKECPFNEDEAKKYVENRRNVLKQKHGVTPSNTEKQSEWKEVQSKKNNNKNEKKKEDNIQNKNNENNQKTNSPATPVADGTTPEKPISIPDSEKDKNFPNLGSKTTETQKEKLPPMITQTQSQKTKKKTCFLYQKDLCFVPDCPFEHKKTPEALVLFQKWKLNNIRIIDDAEKEKKRRENEEIPDSNPVPPYLQNNEKDINDNVEKNDEVDNNQQNNDNNQDNEIDKSNQNSEVEDNNQQENENNQNDYNSDDTENNTLESEKIRVHTKPIDSNEDISFPTTIIESFIKIAKDNTIKKKETLGYIYENIKDPKKKHILIPVQDGSFTWCQSAEDDKNVAKITEFQEKHGLRLIGWIHTHPDFDGFLSSVDLHTAFNGTKATQNPNFLSIVIDKDDLAHFFYIYPEGAKILNDCDFEVSLDENNTPANEFHKHIVDNSEIYYKIDAESIKFTKHQATSCTVVDFREEISEEIFDSEDN